MFNSLLFFISLVLAGCGGTSFNTDKVADAINDQNQSQVVNIDVNETNITTITEVNQTTVIDNNITVVINPSDTNYYGDGSFLTPFQMKKANYKIPQGDVWFMTPIINANCTIRVRTRVYITNIVVEDEFFNTVPINTISPTVFSFDLNNTRYATMNIRSYASGYITTTGACLDEPKYFTVE